MGFSIFMIVAVVIFGVGGLLIMKRQESAKKKSSHQPSQQQMTANEFINVRDIRGRYLYTRDQYVLTYLRVTPISIDLLSHNEQRNLIRQLTASLSSLQTPFKFVAVSRPVDITPLITDLSDLLLTEDRKQKEILKLEINEMMQFALSGEVVERQFYMVLWEKQSEDVEQDLRVKAQELIARFAENNIMLEHIEQGDIIKLCNLVYNPSIVHLEDTNVDPSLSILKGYYYE